MENAQPARILVADDNPQGAELLEVYLASTGADVRIAADGEETLRIVREWSPDLLLLDVMMPRLSGFEVCKQLRADPVTRNVPVIMVTALDQASDVERAVEAGTNDFLTKPIDQTELRLRVRAMLNARRISEEPAATLAYFEEVQRPSF
jgi:DNA-binding response OmpR family regulator